MINSHWISVSAPVEFFLIQSDPDAVLNCRIRLDRDLETGSIFNTDAQSSILHIENAEKTYDYGLVLGV